jgi:peptidoglycan/LPS O-acetylase OafA/YrhL
MMTTVPDQTNIPAEGSGGKSTRLHYLDWLQVLAILGVFLFHAFHPFDDLFDWHIKNAESNILVVGSLYGDARRGAISVNVSHACSFPSSLVRSC